MFALIVCLRLTVSKTCGKYFILSFSVLQYNKKQEHYYILTLYFNGQYPFGVVGKPGHSSLWLPFYDCITSPWRVPKCTSEYVITATHDRHLLRKYLILLLPHKYQRVELRTQMILTGWAALYNDAHVMMKPQQNKGQIACFLCRLLAFLILREGWTKLLRRGFMQSPNITVNDNEWKLCDSDSRYKFLKSTGVVVL